MKYYIGIDGGGTKTVYALFDENKNMVSQVRTEGTNHENMEGSFAAAAEILCGGIETLLESCHLSQEEVEAVLLGLAGMDHPYQIAIMEEELKKHGLFCKTYIFNDGYIVTKAGSTDGTGIGYNCGTGTCCNSIGVDGKRLQFGGLKYSGDKGNGGWIASAVWQSIYDEVCLGIRNTIMTSLFFEKFGADRSPEYFLSTLQKLDNEECGGFIKDLITIYFEALNAGDQVALTLCEEMSERGAEFIAAHFQWQDFGNDPVNVVLSGSIHTNLPSDIYIRMLEKKTREKVGRELRFIRLTCPPVVGCINWLLDGTLQ